MPIFFKNMRGSTCGVEYNNEIWFITHFNIEQYGKYYHCFIVFDKNMKLLRFSDYFSFEGYEVEFCLGFIITENEFLISYSIMDNYSKIGIYDKNYIINNLSLFTKP